ncbi:MAG: molybdopterin dinucleotide-binding protein [Methanomicrobiales archaeon HGW-Methanomicrobiales-4]|nr:MAG: molybdopterin dinucleotide-binding protein [Methanomicrobiales archaeon HGW-Methanomicrobiales-4]
MRLIINTGRTVVQGSHVDLKNSKEYSNEASLIRMNPIDMMKLGVDSGEHVRASADGVSLTLKAIEDTSLEEGAAFLPLGPYANFLVAGITHGTGMPDFKHISADIEPSDQKVVTVGELMQQLGGVPYAG